MWKGEADVFESSIDVTVRHAILYGTEEAPIRYRLSFSEMEGRFFILDEVIESKNSLREDSEEPSIYYLYHILEKPWLINVVNPSDSSRYDRQLRDGDVNPVQSILSQRRDSATYPELTYLSNELKR